MHFTGQVEHMVRFHPRIWNAMTEGLREMLPPHDALPPEVTHWWDDVMPKYCMHAAADAGQPDPPPTVCSDYPGS